MGMTIDNIKHCLKVMVDYEVCEECNLYGTTGTDHCEHDCVYGALDIIDKYQLMQADYETRLKADMVAILTELQLEIEENTVRWYVGRVDGKSDDVVLMETINDIIQQKINTLKENEDGTDEQKEAINEMP